MNNIKKITVLFLALSFSTLYAGETKDFINAVNLSLGVMNEKIESKDLKWLKSNIEATDVLEMRGRIIVNLLFSGQLNFQFSCHQSDHGDVQGFHCDALAENENYYSALEGQ